MAAHRLFGGCRCGGVALEVELPRGPGSYQPRACDCDFCRERGVAYLSDPDGRLRIRPRSPAGLRTDRQGSQQAEFLSCDACGTLLAVVWKDGGHAYAAVNARALGDRGEFGVEQAASPWLPDAARKAARWKALWFADVGVAAG
jgi:hypothetical protein